MCDGLEQSLRNLAEVVAQDAPDTVVAATSVVVEKFTAGCP